MFQLGVAIAFGAGLGMAVEQPSVSEISTRGLLTTEAGGAHCIARFEPGGEFGLADYCRQKFQILRMAVRWSIKSDALAILAAEEVELARFARDGHIWRAAAPQGGPDLILIFMRVEIEPH